MTNKPRDLAEASRALESTLVKQLLQSSGAFRGNGGAGTEVHAQMFMEVLAEAVTKDGGFGLATMLEKSLTPPGGDPDAAGDLLTAPHPGDEVGAAVQQDPAKLSPKKALNAYGVRAEATDEESRKQASMLP